MIIYLIKSGLCLTVLLAIYLVLLEQQKIHQFNRFFLLFALAFGLSTPLITLEYNPPIVIKDFQNRTYQLIDSETPFAETSILASNDQPNSFSFRRKLVLGYGFICLVLALRFCRNVLLLFRNSRCHPYLIRNGFRIVLLNKQTIPHSFFTSVFVDKELYENGKINPSIIDHEAVHAKQYHSLDILLVEILRIAFWFNPIFYLYKRAIQLNHEFIADQYAIKNIDSNHYKKLMLAYSTHNQNAFLASSFNFSLTKKRLTMITKQQKRLQCLIRKLLLLPILPILVFVFSQKVVAQDIQTASISDLIDQLNTKLDYSKSLTAAETEKLTELIRKLQKREGLALPPPPKVISVKEVPKVITAKEAALSLQKPVKVSVVEPEALKKARKAYTNAVRVYLSLDSQKTLLQELESSYQKVKKAFDALSIEIKNTDYGSKPSPPPPPLPPNPEQRKKYNG